MALCTAGTTTLTDAYRYDGYGQLITSAGSALNPYRYRGLLNIGSDSLTWALADMGERDYSAQLGAFTQADSVQGSAANPLSLNRFLYALANPATLVDPDGHFAMEYDSDPFWEGSCKALGDVGCGRTAVNQKAKIHAAAKPTCHLVGPCAPRKPTPDYVDPVELYSDPAWQALTADTAAACVQSTLGVGGNSGACVASNDQSGFEQSNAYLYCLVNRATCDARKAEHDRFVSEDNAQGFLFGLDLIATGLMLIDPVPGDEAVPAADALRRAQRMAGTGGPGGGGSMRGLDFVVTESGIAIPIPNGFQGRMARNRAGLVFQRPGATDNTDMLRIGDPNPLNPTGFIRYYNSIGEGQPLDAFGNPGSRAMTHLSLSGWGIPWVLSVVGQIQMNVIARKDRYELSGAEGSVIRALIIDFAFSVRIEALDGSDVLIRIEEPFEFTDAFGTHRVEPESPSTLVPVTVLNNVRLESLQASLDGELLVALSDSRMIRVPVHPSFESWHMTLSGGPMMIGGPGPHVSIFDRADSQAPTTG